MDSAKETLPADLSLRLRQVFGDSTMKEEELDALPKPKKLRYRRTRTCPCEDLITESTDVSPEINYGNFTGVSNQPTFRTGDDMTAYITCGITARTSDELLTFIREDDLQLENNEQLPANEVAT
jgi:hypothetical protein